MSAKSITTFTSFDVPQLDDAHSIRASQKMTIGTKSNNITGSSIYFMEN
jgi:hypothetical protein